MNTLWLVSNAPPAAVATSSPLVYDTSYPFCSMNRIIGYSAYINQLRPWSSSAEWNGRLYDTFEAPRYAAGFPGGQFTVHEYRLLPPYVLYACHVSSEVWNNTSEWLESFRTTNTI